MRNKDLAIEKIEKIETWVRMVKRENGMMGRETERMYENIENCLDELRGMIEREPHTMGRG